jgi:hypothetical protein
VEQAEEEERQRVLDESLARRIEIERMYAASVPDDFWESSKYTVRRLGQAMEVYECLERLGAREFYTWDPRRHVEELGLVTISDADLAHGLLVVDGMWNPATFERQMFIFDAPNGFLLAHRAGYTTNEDLVWWSNGNAEPPLDCMAW